MNWHQFFIMDGFGPYVWATYFIMTIVLVINISIIYLEGKAVRKIVRRFLS